VVNRPIVVKKIVKVTTVTNKTVIYKNGKQQGNGIKVFAPNMAKGAQPRKEPKRFASSPKDFKAHAKLKTTIKGDAPKGAGQSAAKVTPIAREVGSEGFKQKKKTGIGDLDVNSGTTVKDAREKHDGKDGKDKDKGRNQAKGDAKGGGGQGKGQGGGGEGGQANVTGKQGGGGKHDADGDGAPTPQGGVSGGAQGSVGGVGAGSPDQGTAVKEQADDDKNGKANKRKGQNVGAREQDDGAGGPGKKGKGGGGQGGKQAEGGGGGNKAEKCKKNPDLPACQKQ
jgi:hypothetical protein